MSEMRGGSGGETPIMRWRYRMREHVMERYMDTQIREEEFVQATLMD